MLARREGELPRIALGVGIQLSKRYGGKPGQTDVVGPESEMASLVGEAAEKAQTAT